MIILHVFFSLVTLASPSLNGDWERPCENGVLRKEVVTAGTATYTERFHFDIACTQPAFEIAMLGEIRTHGHNFDFRITRVLARPLEDSMTVRWNQKATCGSRLWRSSSFIDVSGRPCDFFLMGSPLQVPRPGSLRHGIWRIDGDRLYFGRMTSQFDGSTPERRPRDWDPRPYFRVPSERHFSIR